jgi:predicted RNA-binding Zn-ribbon protein involved in translation (DUF1610 family)
MVTFVTCEGCGKQILCDESSPNKHCNHCGKPFFLAPMRAPQGMVVAQPAALAETKPCPFCGESIQGAAVKCRHCGEMLDPSLRAAYQPQPLVVSSPVYVQSVQQVVIPRADFNHGIHLLLTVLTCGLWLPVWILAWLIHAMLA